MSSALNGVLAQIQSQAQEDSLRPGFASGIQEQQQKNALSFSDALFNSINEINQTQLTSKKNVQEWMSGNKDIGLNDVMLSMQKSSVAFNFGVQVRNKMIGAYQEVMNMPV